MAATSNTRLWVRKIHRWMGLLIGIQLLLWTVSGLYFSLVPIESIRGEDRIREAAAENFAFTPLASPATAITNLVAQTGPSVQVRAVQLRRILDAPVYQIHYALAGEKHIALADAVNAKLRPPLSEAEAIQIAQRDFASDSAATAVEYVEQVAAGSEYRGGVLPAWRVSFAHDNGTNIYVSAELGEVTARRNNDWRVWDFMWMLHIADFDARDNFNTFLLQFLAVLALVSILSGFLLWGITTSLFRGKPH